MPSFPSFISSFGAAFSLPEGKEKKSTTRPPLNLEMKRLESFWLQASLTGVLRGIWCDSWSSCSQLQASLPFLNMSDGEKILRKSEETPDPDPAIFPQHILRGQRDTQALLLKSDGGLKILEINFGQQKQIVPFFT